MKVLIYRYGSICEPDIISGFKELGFEVNEMTEEISNKELLPRDCARIVSQFLLDHPQDFVFSINFFPIVSEVCNIFKIPYLCWTVDSPVLELFSKSIKNPCNRIFVFDRAQYNEIYNFNPQNIFYFPLAVNIKQKQESIKKAPIKQRNRFTAEISFVGSLYSEKCPYDKLKNVPDYLNGYLDGIIESQLQIYGYYFVDELLSDSIVSDFKNHLPGFYAPPEDYILNDKMITSQLYIGNKITAVERERTMRLLSNNFDMDIYTGSDTSRLPNIHNKGFAKTLTEMPVIFHESKINLNTTSKAIRTGIPLRIFDIMGCEGFVMTNYQSELPELFDIGNELVSYGSMDELIELTDYYLHHDSERKEIAHNGFEKVKNEYNYPLRLSKLLQLAFLN